MEKFDIEKYEYKAPSYRLRKNRPLFWIDEKKYARESRYDIADGIWKSRQGAKDEISILLSGDLLCQENLIEGYRKKEGGYDCSQLSEGGGRRFRHRDESSAVNQ